MKVVYKIFVLLLAGPVVFIFAKSIKNVKWFRYLFVSLHALFLTYCTLFLLNRPEWRWTEQRSILKNIGDTESKKAYEFIGNNFLLIDNSFDKMLLPNPDGDESDSTSLVLTNRKSLVSFLKLLNEQSANIDLVILDIGFKHPTGDDSLLKDGLLKLYANDKILLSIDPQDKENIRMIENPGGYGNISEKSKENLFTSHTIYKDGFYSLPYKIYSWMNKRTPGKLSFDNELFREKNLSGYSSLGLNTFFPAFSMTNESILRGEEPISQNNVSLGMDKGAESDSRVYFFLSQPLSPDGKDEFIKNLQQRKKSGKRNLVFIGAFASSDEDVHQTLYGDLHGTTIILNVLYALQKKKHVLGFGYLFFLLTGYFIISMILFYKGLGIKIVIPEKLKKILRIAPGKGKKSKRGNKGVNKTQDGVIKWFKNLADFIFYFLFVKELPLTLLIIFSIIVQLLFGHWPNILPLLIYLAGIMVSLEYARKKILKINTKTQEDH